MPAQGGAATTAANNAVLANILSTISRERFRYVGVVATDTRDKLFLIRLIREYCPDVHVFVTQADLLLTHPDYLYHMKGVVVGSTYPLYAAEPAVGEPQRHRAAAAVELRVAGVLQRDPRADRGWPTRCSSTPRRRSRPDPECRTTARRCG